MKTILRLLTLTIAMMGSAQSAFAALPERLNCRIELEPADENQPNRAREYYITVRSMVNGRQEYVAPKVDWMID
ncbi:MAG: hypothetical protein V4760_14865, partial [Bdellovibrionota bacterium]